MIDDKSGLVWISLTRIVLKHKNVFLSISVIHNIDFTQVEEIPSNMEDRNMFILQSEYHGCWWPGNARSQAISSNNIDLVIPDYSSFLNKGII